LTKPFTDNLIFFKSFPTNDKAREELSLYYLNGLSVQDEGEYAEALNNSYQAFK
jgi:hypothetical protein